MSDLAAILVEERKLAEVAAVRAAYASIGAYEGEGVRVVIGVPENGWCAIATEMARVRTELGSKV